MKYNINEERFRKFGIIIELYKKRGYSQENIAQKLKIPKKIVEDATQLANYFHGIKITPENLKEGQTIKPVIFAEDLTFLDPYNF